MGLDRLNDLRAQHLELDAQLRDAIDRVVGRGVFALGPEVEAFEREFAAYCGVDHCVGVANGTDALELALRALGVEAGDEVVTAANAGMYATTAILAIGAKPVFADVDPTRLTLSAEAAAAALGSRTRAVVATHLYGRLAAVEELRALADRSGVALVEDCAQAHGARRGGIVSGAFGDAAAFSFYPTKNLGALGDGGAVLARDAATAERVRRLRQYGWERKYVSTLAGGRNSRLDKLQAALLRVKLPRLDAWNTRRREVAACWTEALAGSGLRLPTPAGEDDVVHLFVVRSTERAALRSFLREHGIASEVHYPLLDTQQPRLAGRYSGVSLPESERAVEQVLTLPCHPQLAPAVVREAGRIVRDWKAT